MTPLIKPWKFKLAINIKNYSTFILRDLAFSHSTYTWPSFDKECHFLAYFGHNLINPIILVHLKILILSDSSIIIKTRKLKYFNCNKLFYSNWYLVIKLIDVQIISDAIITVGQQHTLVLWLQFFSQTQVI